MKKYKSLYLRIKNNIESGIIKPGERLPSIREEAASSMVSINTVINAYNILTDEGLIRARERGGYYARAGSLALTQEGSGKITAQSDKYITTARTSGERLDQLFERLLHIDPSFAVAAPGSDILPAESLRRIAASLRPSWMSYANPEGDYTLRRRIAIANQEIDGMMSPDNIVITNGATEAMSITMRTLLSPDDTIALESPTYFNYFRQLTTFDIKIIEIPVKGDGIDLDILETELKRQKIRMIITQPNVQNPTGVTMSDDSKKRLIALAEKHGSYLVQDDVYGDIYFGPIRPCNLTCFSDYQRLIQVSSFSKTVSPGLRIGWIQAQDNIDLFIEEKLRTAMDTNRFAQGIMANYVGTTAHRRHLKKLKLILKQRVEDYIEFLSEILPSGSFVRRPSGGCLLWISLPPHINATRIFELSARKGLVAAPGDLFSTSDFFNHYIRINVGMKLTPNRRKALSILGETARS